MNNAEVLKKLIDSSDNIVFFGGAGVSTDIVQLHRTKGRGNMKTAEEIIAYLKAELAEAYEMYDKAKGKDASQAFAYMLKATTLTHILEEIENE